MKIRFVLLLLVALLWNKKAACQIAIDTSQSNLITISGVVYSAIDSLGLGGVDVLVKGKAFGTITDELGRFSIKVSDKDTFLIISQEGKIPQELPIPFSTKSVQVYLQPEPAVIAYPHHAELQTYFTGSAEKVDFQNFYPGTRNSVENLLQGRVAGMQVMQKSGVLTSESFIRLRGIASVVAGGEPLFVVDGVPVISGTQGDGGGSIGTTYGAPTTPLAELVIDDIAQVEVLKDAWATGIYGARAANGVIHIKTKQGRPGKTLFRAGVSTSVLSPTQRLQMLNTDEFLSQYQKGLELTAERVGRPVPALSQSLHYLAGTDSLIQGLAAARNINTRWLDEVLQRGMQQQVDLSAAGGNKNVTFYFSGNYLRQHGILRNHDNERLSVRFNSDVSVSEKLKFGSRIALSLGQANFAFTGTDTTGGFVAAQTKALPYFPVYNNQAGVAANPYPFNNFFAPYDFGHPTLTTDRNHVVNERLIFRTIGAVNGSYTVNEQLSLTADVGFDYFSSFDRLLRSRFMRLGTFVTPQGDTVSGPSSLASDFRVTHFSINAGTGLHHHVTVGSVGKLSTTIGAFTQRVVTKFNGVSSELFPSDYSRLVSFGSRQAGEPIGAETGFAFANFYARSMYVHQSKYMGGLHVATTGSTRYGEEVSALKLLPVATAGWVFSQEPWLNDVAWLNFGKLKASYGYVGNSLIDNEQAQGFWRGNRPYMEPFSYPGQSPYRAPNPQLMFERFRVADVGIETSLLSNRLQVLLNYYNKLNTNVIQVFPLPPSQGLDLPEVVKNGGKIKNSGIELGVQSNNLSGDLSWTTYASVATLNSKVVDMGGLLQEQSPRFKDLVLAEGQPFGTYFLPRWGGIAVEDNPEKGWKKGDELLIARDGNLFRPRSVAQIDSHRVLIEGKSIQPKLFGGINNAFTYGRFELSFLFVYAWGNHVLDEGERISSYLSPNQNLRAQRSYTNANVYVSGVPQLDFVDPLSQVNTTRFLHDASFIRLRNLMLAYQLKRSDMPKWGLDNLKAYIALQNFLTFTRFKGWDPESSINTTTGSFSRNFGIGYTRFDLPQVKSITLGINISF